MFRAVCTAVLALPVLLAAAAAPAQRPMPLLPETIDLPQGFQPEGIAKGPGTRAFVGTLNGGGVIDVDLASGRTRFLVPARAARMATGLVYSESADTVLVAGAGSGQAFLYDASNGRQLAAVTLTTAQPNFINDVRLSSTAAFFTDSMRPVLYRVPLTAGGRRLGAVQEIELAKEFGFVPGEFNANGIAAVLDGRFLLIVKSNTGELFRVDPQNGAALKVDLGPDSLLNGDGLLLEGNRLLVVQNSLNQIAVVELDASFSTGRVLQRLTDIDFSTPTTVASFDGILYAVNARFDQVAPGTAQPTDRFNLVRVSR